MIRIGTPLLLVALLTTPVVAQAPVPLTAQPCPPCTLHWDHNNPDKIPVYFNIYWSEVPGGPYTKIGTYFPPDITPSYDWPAPPTLVNGGVVVVTAVWESPNSNEAVLPAAMRVGVVVSPTAFLNVRSTPNGIIVGQQLKGAKGTIIGGPTTINGVTWWQIDYQTGADGWSSGSYLVLAPE